MWSAFGLFREIIQNPDGTFTVVFVHNTKWHLAALNHPTYPGKLTSIVDRNGNTMTFGYNASGRLSTITDTLGRVITIAYNAQNFISSLTDFATDLGLGGNGRVISYAYYTDADPGGSAGDLKSVTFPAVVGTPNDNNFPNGKTWTYTYSENFLLEALNRNLLTVKDGKGQTYVTNAYATTNDPMDLVFDRVLSQSLSNLGGKTFNYFYAVQIPGPGNNDAVAKTIVNDRVGNVEELFYDLFNRLAMRREFTGRAPNPAAQTTDTQNRPINPLRPGVDPTHFETRFEYNTDSLITRAIYPNGNSVEYAYNSSNPSPRGRGIRVTQRSVPGPLGGDQTDICWRWSYDSIFNFPTAEQDARGNITRWFYDSAGDRGQLPSSCIGVLTADELGKDRWDNRAAAAGSAPGTGNVQSTECIVLVEHILGAEPFGPGPTVCNANEYNQFGQLTSRTRCSGRRDEYTYYSTGPMTGYLESVIIDATDFAFTTTYQYDTAGNVRRIIDPKGNDTLYHVNALNQTVHVQSREVELASGCVRYQRDFFYDLNDNLDHVDVQNVDEDGDLQANTHFTTAYEYDTLDNLTKITREVNATQNVVVRYDYDANDNLTLTRYGQANAGVNPQSSNVLRELYDERDLLFREIRAEGASGESTTQYDYDGNENLIAERAGLQDNPRVHSWVYDGYDRVATRSDPANNLARRFYDPNHNPTEEIVEGEFVESQTGESVILSHETREFDEWDRPHKFSRVFFKRGGRRAPEAPLSDGKDDTLIGYDKQSHVKFVCKDRGLVRGFKRNSAELSQQNSTTPVSNPTQSSSSRDFDAYDGNANPTNIADRVLSELTSGEHIVTWLYEYDALDRVKAASDNLDQRWEFGYDSRDNMVLYTDAKGNRTRFEYDGLSRLTRVIHDMDDDGASPRTLSTPMPGTIRLV